LEQAGADDRGSRTPGRASGGSAAAILVLYGLWAANYVAIDVNTLLPLAKQILARAQEVNATGPLVIGNRLTATSLLMLGQFEAARVHYDRAVALYVPEIAPPVGGPVRPGYRSAGTGLSAWALWHLAILNAALKDARAALENAREIGQAGTLMYTLCHAAIPEILAGQVAWQQTHAED